MFLQQVLTSVKDALGLDRVIKVVAVILLGAVLTACAGNKYDVNQSGASVAKPGTPQDFAVNVGDRVFFETDSTDLTARGQATLNLQSAWLAKYPQYKATMEGHADERGTREYNIALGARRASAAKAYLIARGISAARLGTISYGKERPVAVCNDISCWSQNRRSVTTLTSG
ncbi:MAG: peptidoglycan-associated lipoprotein [Hyphomicrobiales bacterium]|nr:MAG: peptidoglycan-associated lipoprotein [Hyphomicrobiales bacterium]